MMTKSDTSRVPYLSGPVKTSCSHPWPWRSSLRPRGSGRCDLEARQSSRFPSTVTEPPVIEMLMTIEPRLPEGDASVGFKTADPPLSERMKVATVCLGDVSSAAMRMQTEMHLCSGSHIGKHRSNPGPAATTVEADPGVHRARDWRHTATRICDSSFVPGFPGGMVIVVTGVMLSSAASSGVAQNDPTVTDDEPEEEDGDKPIRGDAHPLKRQAKKPGALSDRFPEPTAKFKEDGRLTRMHRRHSECPVVPSAEAGHAVYSTWS